MHINAAEVEGYIEELLRVLRPGGVAVIHHGGVGGTGGGWRSNLTADTMTQMLARAGLETQQVLDQWIDGTEVRKLAFGDLITVISRPPEGTARKLTSE